ncbi:hypothetical protein AB0D83_37020 [Streptomyces decoyicus]|uniref:hypothetical protein n=1 Tax=Streptomyces decoyicus TaxID=249567 RepID=UPI00340F1DA2
MPSTDGAAFPSDFEAAEIKAIERANGWRFAESNADYLTFELNHVTWRREVGVIPVEAARVMLNSISQGGGGMDEFEGWVDAKAGLVEFSISMDGIGALRGSTADRFTYDVHPCHHSHEFEPPHFEDEIKRHIHPVLRVTSRDRSTCVEISPSSPLCAPLMPLEDNRTRDRRPATLKVHFDARLERDEILHKALDLANSFLFELNVRNRILYSLRPKLERLAVTRHAIPANRDVRFPKIAVPQDAAALFAASQQLSARDGSVLTYLSLYQVLEHYFPAVHRREAVRKVRRILRSVDFDEHRDSSVMKILSSVERSHGASEGEQLRTLLEECVSDAKLKDFFSLDHSGHFNRNGPISGVNPINPKNEKEPLASQVAKRVYQLRNRIVHAKDDVRFSESKVLLPTSREACNLGPDFHLLRMLAIEVIVDNQ